MDQFHLKSMTAYGRGTAAFPYGRFTLEIQSVNRRFLEINLGLPRSFSRFEVEIRKRISERVGRGMLNATLTWKSDGAQPVTVIPNLSLAKALKQAWENLNQELGIQEDISLDFLAKQNNIMLYEEEILNEETYWNAIQSALDDALDAFVGMKNREGEMLTLDLKKRLATLHGNIHLIEQSSGTATEKYRQKLKDRLEELFTGHSENEERVLKEVALFAERVDVTEEIVRFNGHLDQFKILLEKPLENELETRGKTLDFLLQELLREINTIGSKASDLIVAQTVVAVKAELEKIREQVQNIE